MALMTPAEIADTQMKICRLCKGQSLMNTDRALDDARRWLWAEAFGVRKLPRETPKETEKLEFRIASMLIEQPLDTVHEVLEGARIAMWHEAIPSGRPTLFRKAVHAH